MNSNSDSLFYCPIRAGIEITSLQNIFWIDATSLVSWQNQNRVYHFETTIYVIVN